MTIDRKKKFIINVAYIAVVLILLYAAVRFLSAALLPFVIGFICAIVLQKPIAYLHEKTKIHRGIWATLLIVLIFAVLFGVIVLAGYQLSDQLTSLVNTIKTSLPGFQKSLQNIAAQYSGLMESLPDELEEIIRSTPSKILEGAVASFSEVATNLAAATLVSLPNLLITTVISIVACCFITTDYNKITKFILRQFSPKNQQLILKAKRVFIHNILKMLRGYTIIIFITFFELFVGFLIMDIPYTATLAILVSIVDILPILGTGTVLIPWGVIALILGDPFIGVGMLVLYVIITVIRNVIEPKIIGDQVGLPAIVTLVAMYVGLKLFGVLGLFGLPLFIILLAKLQEAGMIHIWKTKDDETPAIKEEI